MTTVDNELDEIQITIRKDLLHSEDRLRLFSECMDSLNRAVVASSNGDDKAAKEQGQQALSLIDRELEEDDKTTAIKLRLRGQVKGQCKPFSKPKPFKLRQIRDSISLLIWRVYGYPRRLYNE